MRAPAIVCLNSPLMNSPLLLLILLSVAIQVTMPIGTYLLFSDRSDDKAKLWFVGMSAMAAGISLAALRPFLPPLLSHQLAWLLVLFALQMMVDVFRLELGLPLRRRTSAALVGTWAIYLAAVYIAGTTKSWGMAGYSAVMPAYCVVLSGYFSRLRQQAPSKSLVLLQIGAFLYGAPSILRLYAFVMTGDPESMNVFQFTWATNILILSFVVAILFMCLGYWGFTLEKSTRERNFAEQQRQRAEGDADAMRQLLQERDRLLMINSQFSAISSLSSFAAMLVHDISQPLQKLQLGLMRLRSHLNQTGLPAPVADSLNNLDSASERAGEMVAALRNLMTRGEQQARSLCLKAMLEGLEPILAGEAKQRGIALTIRNWVPEGTMVLADETMVRRIVLNVVGNAYEQLHIHPKPVVTLDLRLQRENGVDGVALCVTDNGAGFPATLLERLGQPWTSSKPDGLGLGLLLSKQLLELWGGRLRLSNNSAGLAGATAEIWLRQQFE